MKNILSVLLGLLLVTTYSFACDGHGEGEKKASTEQSGGDVVVAKFAALTLDVKGMTCGGCENKVKAALSGINGVVETQKVSAQTNSATITFDPSVTSSDAIAKSLAQKTGYAITVVKNAGVDGTSAAKACCASKEAGKTCSKEEAKTCGKTSTATKSCSETKSVGTEKLEKE
jgi:copper chaperone CopZ